MCYIDITLADKLFWFWILKFKLTSFLSFLSSEQYYCYSEMSRNAQDFFSCHLSLPRPARFHTQNRVCVISRRLLPLHLALVWWKEGPIYTIQNRARYFQTPGEVRGQCVPLMKLQKKSGLGNSLIPHVWEVITYV